MRGNCKIFCLSGLLIVFSYNTAGQTCRGRCGDVLEKCSCHDTCMSLMSCCADYNQSCFQVIPYSSSMLGGKALRILGLDLHPHGQLLCRFKGEILRDGFIDAEGRAYCISPLLYETGWIPFDVSTDGIKFDRSAQYFSDYNQSCFQVMPHSSSMLGGKALRILGLDLHPHGQLLCRFKGEILRDGFIDIEGRAYCISPLLYETGWIPFDVSTDGIKFDRSAQYFSVHPSKADPAYKVTLVNAMQWQYYGTPNVAGRLEFTWNSSLISAEKVNIELWGYREFKAKEETVCTYHPGCVHCVRAIHASPIHGSGQQCCYDSTGALVLTGDSVGGSTPDRAHDWGSPPYIKPPRVPGYSHWLYDVMSFYYCCLWSDHCHIYLKRRPSSGCQNYRPPRAGVVLGDPHFITFDGLRYTFNGKGEYYLVSSPAKGLSVQARTEQVKLKNGESTFEVNGNISKNSSLFTYDSEHLLDMYNIPPSHDPTFVPAFSLPESLDDPLVADMLTMCYGEGSQFCKYDTLTTRDLTVGNATLKAYQKHQALLYALKPVVSCGWLPTPRNGWKNGTDYLEGSTLSFACNKGYIMYGSAERTCLGDGTWAGDQPFCITEKGKTNQSRW
ncbi:sushi domain-containing protein 2 [Pundamilia nyererei]|uniref:Sushi domain-containing protein 2 n=1 Tax=Pundamilia nyererei TaxID=303518 RepID=A0A9Y6JJR2_9CICH|nr:PREDICTED: sushi domain-containing protein 2-like [Pundamilia nyererei]